MPGQQRLRSDDRIQFEQHAAPEPFGLRRQSPPLAVGEAQALIPQLLPKHSVLFPEVIDQLRLSAVHPARQGDQDELKLVQEAAHRGRYIIAASTAGASICLRISRIEFPDITGSDERDH